MMDQRTFRLRVTFGLSGRLVMLSHLELTHALERMVRRANLPFALSQGFSPHMKIAFGSALPVGIGGTNEIFDITLTDYIAPAKALKALQAVAPENLMPFSAEYIEAKAKAASIAFPISTYEVVFSGPVGSYQVPEIIEVVRKKKQKTLAVEDYLIYGPEVEGDRMTFTLESKSSGNLRPDLLLKNCAGLPSIISIMRISQD